MTHIKAVQIKHRPPLSILFLAQVIITAKEEIISWGRIIVRPNHLITAYQTAAPYLQ
jgi:hypothetical protein